jgi:hypothetical protein
LSCGDYIQDIRLLKHGMRSVMKKEGYFTFNTREKLSFLLCQLSPVDNARCVIFILN